MSCVPRPTQRGIFFVQNESNPKDQICLTREEALQIQEYKRFCAEQKLICQAKIKRYLKENQTLRGFSESSSQLLDRQCAEKITALTNAMRAQRQRETAAWVLVGVVVVAGASAAIIVWGAKK